MESPVQHPDDARAAVESNPLWYHTMELPGGVVTPGWFDLRPVVDRMPWPDVRDKRCLDVGPYDGFLTFELERRGAAEVVAADIGSPWEWDWAFRDREIGPQSVAAMSGERTGEGFRIAKEALGSKVERIEVSAYDLSPENVGTFDVVVCGSLMLHLREPVRALESIRSVCSGLFLSAEEISLSLTLRKRGRAAARFLGGDRCQWWVPNAAGHRLMLEAAGFEIQATSRLYAIRLGPAHPARNNALSGAREHVWPAPFVGGIGVPHSAALCKPISAPPTAGSR